MQQKLTYQHNSYSKTLFCAGLPTFPRNFTRDSIISALLMEDTQMLKNQLEFTIIHQGKKINPNTGEERGKIFHEFPGFKLQENSDKTTLYNGCDTTALFLIGISFYIEKTQDYDFLVANKHSIEEGIMYIKNHLNNNYEFIEDPSFSDTDSYALKVTYWKDSILSGRENGEPKYPIVYTLVHILNMVAIKNMSLLLEDNELHKIYTKMRQELHTLYDYKNKCFFVARDEEGYISGVTTDSLHALMYLEKEDIPQEFLEGIKESAKELETPIGYRVMSKELAKNMFDSYHAKTIWPFEQAVIHKGAEKFNIRRVCEVSEKICDIIKDNNYEIYYINDNDNFKPGGCHTQLWTIAAKKYFNLM